ncbi:MAG: glucose-1-phosphate thymidylyltransferase [Candidatus Tectomicrobia bacterium]|uniref:Glucose-1-phosphate thymidylyltransferase n=1 Tax=Tectimicrobiota bacterium TaxID=2528274 RepID=A0A932FXP9_UNCTE|nr:glucose-1-phosphate thymidylyltransferase [Candidatus Tectomicrobia bacterium]
MKGLILSGGKGSRLRPITHTRAKQLVPVANKPVLFYGIEALVETGIREIGIVVGDTQDEIRGAVGDGSAWGARITYIEQEAPLGLAHAVLVSEGFLQEESFVMYLGDNLIKHGIRDFVEEFQRNGSHSQILLAHVPNPQHFGVAELQGDQVVRLVEKPKEPKSDLALVGVYMFDHHIFEAARRIRPSWRGELEITDAIQYLIEAGMEVRSQVVHGWWKDTGKVEDLLEANRMVLDGVVGRLEGTVDASSRVEFKVVLESGAEVVNSMIRGPAVIGKNSRIVNAYVGPFTSIEQNVVIENSEIEHSIVLRHSALRHIPGRISDSLIGEHVEVSQSPANPKIHCFILGDYSRIELP